MKLKNSIAEDSYWKIYNPNQGQWMYGTGDYPGFTPNESDAKEFTDMKSLRSTITRMRTSYCFNKTKSSVHKINMEDLKVIHFARTTVTYLGDITDINKFWPPKKWQK